MSNLKTQEMSRRGFVLYNTRLRRYDYKAWEVQKQMHNPKKNTFTDWHKNFDAWGNLPVILRMQAEHAPAPFTAKEIVHLLETYNRTLRGLVGTLEGKSIVVYDYRLRTGRKNEWVVDKYQQKSGGWKSIKYPTQWQTGLEGMLDICIAKGGELIIYHAEALAKRIEKSVQELEHGVLTD